MTPLQSLIQAEIETSGPITVSRYMQLCLAHPVHGYYMKADPLGSVGDFTTAPEISQLFGELIGAWLVDVWRQLGQPDPCMLIELGPGRGTLMADIMRVARLDGAFTAAMSVHLVETSPALRSRQIMTLSKLGIAPTHHDDVGSLLNGPALWIANEFFDALPANQWVHTDKGWNARKIGFGTQNQLAFGVDPTPLPAPKQTPEVPYGTIIEHSPAQDNVMQTIVEHVARHDGAGLIIDYGALKSGVGDTLQAVKSHKPTDPLDSPGEADLTTHVDFAHLARIASQSCTVGVGEQGSFLLALGLLERAGRLGADVSEQDQQTISLAVERLAGDTAMGKLFKVMGFASRPVSLHGLASWHDH